MPGDPKPVTDTLPIVDLAPLGEGEAGLDKVAAAIGAACRDVGFFYAVNHGVKRDLMDEAFSEARRFFALPLADKEAIAMRIVGGNRGYSALLGEALDPTRGPDLKEAFNIGLDLKPDDPELLAGKPFRALNAWPASPGFRETMLAYFDACAALGLKIHRAFARDLGLPLGFLRGQVRPADGDLAAAALPAGPGRPWRGRRRRRPYRLRQYHFARHRRRRRAAGAEARRALDRRAAACGRVRRQYRRLPDALDERHLRLDAPSGDQRQPARALFDRVFFRPQSGRRSRGDPLLRGRGRAQVPAEFWPRTISSSVSTPPISSAKPSPRRRRRRAASGEEAGCRRRRRPERAVRQWCAQSLRPAGLAGPRPRPVRSRRPRSEPLASRRSPINFICTSARRVSQNIMARRAPAARVP